MAPWIFFLFVGVFDFGFYAYAFISTENAARVAAMYAANAGTYADSGAACSYALDELRDMANVGTGVTTCTAAPVTVSMVSSNDANGDPSMSVTVAYQTAQLIPIPGVTGRLTISRTVQMRVNASSS